MQEENITSEPLSGETLPLEGSSDGVEAVGSVPATPEGLSLEELNKHLGKDFKSKDVALKALKDTFSFVGVKKEDVKREVETGAGELARELKALKVDRFFDKNPDLAPYRAAFEKVGGNNPEEFFNSPEFKPIIEKARGYDETQKVRTVLESSPRLASSRDNFTKAKEFIVAGNKEAGEKAATKAVMEAFGDIFK